MKKTNKEDDKSIDKLLVELEALSKKNAELELLNTEHKKKVENNLLGSERRHRALFENMTAGFVLFEVVKDKKGIFLACPQKHYYVYRA